MIKAFRWNFVVLGTALAILAWICWAYLFFPAGYASVMHFWKVSIAAKPYIPFCDISEELSAAICDSRGIPIYSHDVCDTWDRAHCYPIMMPLWDHFIPDPRYLMPVGLILSIITIFTVSLSSRIHSAFEASFLLLMLTSSTVAFVFERANMDMMMFLFLGIAALLYCKNLVYFLDIILLFASILKFYPIVAIAIILNQRPRRAFVSLFSIVLLFFSFLYLARHDFILALTTMVDGKWLTADFGARETYSILALISGFFAGPLLGRAIAGGLCAVIFLLLVFFATYMAKIQRQSPQIITYADASFFIGGVTILFVFLVTGNIAYRGVLLLLLLPLLFQRRHCEAKSDRLTANTLLGCIMLILWLPALYFPGLTINERLLLFWFVKEPLWFLSLGMIAALVFLQAIQFPVSVNLVHSYRSLVRLKRS